MELELVILKEVTKAGKDKYHVIDVESEKCPQVNIYAKQK